LWLEQLPHPAEEAVTVPLLSREAKEKPDIRRLKSALPHFGQVTFSPLLRTRNSNRWRQVLQLYS
jgi:hypothetical protein